MVIAVLGVTLVALILISLYIVVTYLRDTKP